MRYNISTEQSNFFRKEGHVSYAHFLSEKERVSCLETLSKLSTPYLEAPCDSPLYRNLPLSRIGQIATQLFDLPSVRIGFTLYLKDQSGVSQELCVQAFSSFSETVGGVFLLLEHTADCDALFVKESLRVTPSLLSFPSLLIGLIGANSRYLHTQTNPYIHRLKQRGYGYGDLISLETHPFLPFSQR